MRYYPDLPVNLRNGIGRCLLEFSDALNEQGLQTRKDAELVAAHPDLADELNPRFEQLRRWHEYFRDDVPEDDEPEDGGERHHM